MRDALGAANRIVVFGGGSEIGQAIVHRLAADGGVGDVVLAGRNRRAMEQRFSDADDQPPAATVRYDAAEPGAAGKVLAAAVAEGDVDLVVVAAGVLGDDEHNESSVRATDMIAVNFTGAVEAILESVELFERQGHGRLVVLSSVAGQRVRGDLATYGATKAGLDGFCEGMQQRLVGSSIELLIVRPGFVTSKMTDGLPAAPFATDPDSVAADVAQALADGEEVVWSPTILRYVFAVLRWLPTPLWRRVAAR